MRGTDYAAFVVVDKRQRTVTVECRPSSRERLYFSNQGERIEIVAGIEHLSDQVRTALLSSRFVANWLANAARFGGFDHLVPLRSLSERIWYGKACRLPLPGRSRDASIQVK